MFCKTQRSRLAFRLVSSKNLKTNKVLIFWFVPQMETTLERNVQVVEIREKTASGSTYL